MCQAFEACQDGEACAKHCKYVKQVRHVPSIASMLSMCDACAKPLRKPAQ